jgi:hypothetical protein
MVKISRGVKLGRKSGRSGKTISPEEFFLGICVQKSIRERESVLIYSLEKNLKGIFREDSREQPEKKHKTIFKN